MGLISDGKEGGHIWWLVDREIDKITFTSRPLDLYSSNRGVIFSASRTVEVNRATGLVLASPT